MSKSFIFIAVDPGREKCGLAVMDSSGGVHSRKITSTESLCAEVAGLLEKQPEIEAVAVGSGTGSKGLIELLKSKVPERVIVDTVEEYNTTMAARAKYFEGNPPRGLMRLLPPGLRVPPRPVDDYAAVAIGEKYIRTKQGKP